ncbi:MAG: hypothetical protein ACXVIJ_05155 [Thermoanaerobaculia bacterium]
MAPPRTLVCSLCHNRIEVDLEVSWVYSRSAVVMHILECPKRQDNATADDMTKLVEQIMKDGGQSRDRNLQ